MKRIKWVYNASDIDGTEGLGMADVREYEGGGLETLEEVAKELDIDTDFFPGYTMEDEPGWTYYSWRYDCGHEHDCCGCLCHGDFRVSRVADTWVIYSKSYRNV